MRLEAVETLESEGEALQSQMVLQIEGLKREVEDAGRASARLEEEIRGVVGQGVNAACGLSFAFCARGMC